MLESKRFPREFVFKRACSQGQKIRNDRERLRLLREIIGIKETMRKIRRERDRTLQEAKTLNDEAKNLARRSEFWKKLGLILDGVGIAISGGTTNVAKRAIGHAISTISAIFGFSSLEQQIIRKLRRAGSKMDQFENLTGQLNHLEKGMGRMHQTRDDLKC